MLKTPILYNSSTFLRQFFVQTNNRIRNPDSQSNTTGFLQYRKLTPSVGAPVPLPLELKKREKVAQTVVPGSQFWAPPSTPPPPGAKKKGRGWPQL